MKRPNILGQENKISIKSSVARPQRKVTPNQNSHSFSQQTVLKSYRKQVRKTKKSLFNHFFVLANIALLIGVTGVVWAGHNKATSSKSSVASTISSSGSNAQISPLDVVSSADIAANIASVVSLPEASNVSEQADSLSIQNASAPVAESIITKPQLVAGGSKSRTDIQKYVSVNGDTVASLAVKFGVTSDSIRWSNGLTNSNDIPAGKELQIPPRNGVIYKVAAGDTIESVTSRYSANKEQTIAFNDIELSGLAVGETIVIPDGVKPAEPTYTRTTNSSNSLASNNSVSAIDYTAKYGNNTYAPGFCTWYAASRVSIPSNWGNANTWDNYARLSGWTVSQTPVPGAIFQTDAGYAGHVGIVEDVSPDGSQVKVSDMNGISGFGRVGFSNWIPASTYRYIYR